MQPWDFAVSKIHWFGVCGLGWLELVGRMRRLPKPSVEVGVARVVGHGDRFAVVGERLALDDAEGQRDAEVVGEVARAAARAGRGEGDLDGPDGRAAKGKGFMKEAGGVTPRGREPEYVPRSRSA